MLIALGVLVLAVFALVFTVVYLALLVSRTITRYTDLIEIMAQRSEDERERIIQRKQFPDRPPATPRQARPVNSEDMVKRAKRRAALSSVGTVNLSNESQGE